MCSRNSYAPADLCRDLEQLIRIDLPDPNKRNDWLAFAAEILKKSKEEATWEEDFDRRHLIGLYYVPLFLDDGDFMSRHPDYYETEKTKIRGVIAKCKANGRYRQDAL
jgi:hypothetical protein